MKWLLLLPASVCLAATTTSTRPSPAPPDLHESLRLLELAASRGDTEAQVELADHLSSHEPATAARWYAQAAACSADAMWKLGRMFENGDGVSADAARARELYDAAATLGHPEARNSLGNLAMFTGDYTVALRWYRLAAQAGSGEALLNLAGMYYQGLGVKRNIGLAWKYAAAAYRKDVRDARAVLDEIARVRAGR